MEAIIWYLLTAAISRLSRENFVDIANADDVQLLDADLPRNMSYLQSRVEHNLAIIIDWFSQRNRVPLTEV